MVEALKEIGANAVEGLKQQPLLLALVILQVVLLGAVAWTSTQNRAADKERFLAVMQMCGPKTE